MVADFFSSNPGDLTSKAWNQPYCLNADGLMQRCVTDNFSPYFSPNFASKTSAGFEMLIQNMTASMRAFASDVETNYKFSNVSKASLNDFWFLYETMLVEGTAGALNLIDATSSSLIAQSNEQALIGQFCYGISLILTLFTFLFIMRPMYYSLVEQTRYHRAALFLIPCDILRESKPIQKYIKEIYEKMFN
jgi:hypothetical protein